MTGKSQPIAVAFAVIGASQLALGVHIIFAVAAHPGGPRTLSGLLTFLFELINPIVAAAVSSIPFDSFNMCFVSRHRKTEIAYNVISLAYGKASPNSSRF